MQKKYLDAMDIQTWHIRQDTNTLPITELDWKQLQITIAKCQSCPLHQSRKNTVFGMGNTKTDIIVIGEAPGAQEDEQGEPFVGRSGQLLTHMFYSIGLSREEIFITNVLKCRPPNNRDPNPEEVAKCIPYLHRQVSLLEAKLIIAVGRISAHHILGSDLPMYRLRGQVHYVDTGRQKTPLIVTYHPAYLLRSPEKKRDAYQDLLLIKQFIQKANLPHCT